MSEASTSETIDDRKRRESNDDDAAITITATTITTEKTLSPFQAQQVLLIAYSENL